MKILVFRLEDVKNTVDKMEQAVQFRIPAARDNEVIKRLYDSARGKILFALPPKVKIVSSDCRQFHKNQKYFLSRSKLLYIIAQF